MSKHNGIVEFDFLDRTAKLKYDWSALSEIDEDADLKNAIQTLEKNVKPSIIGRLFVIGCKALNPEITYDYLKKQSPPLADCLVAINKALNYAYFGDKELTLSNQDNQDDNKKKTG